MTEYSQSRLIFPGFRRRVVVLSIKICKENRDRITYYCEAYDGLSFFRAFT